MFLIAHTFWKSVPGLITDPSGMVTSPSKTLLWQASPSGAVAGAAEVGRPGACVAPVAGVLTNEKVGRAAGSTVADVFKVGNADVALVVGVTVAVAVFVGAASAVWVNCAESWATVVPTIAVFSALISWVGTGSAPTLQAVKSRAAVSRTSKVCRVDLLENMIVTSVSKWFVCDLDAES